MLDNLIGNAMYEETKKSLAFLTRGDGVVIKLAENWSTISVMCYCVSSTVVCVCLAVFCSVYIVHGLLKELKYEIYMFVCAAAFVLLYCIVEYIVNKSRRSDIKLVMFCLQSSLNAFSSNSLLS